MSEQYFTRIRGTVRGPFTAEKLKELARRGQFSRVHHVSLDGVNWEPAANHPELLPEAKTVNVRKRPTKLEDEDGSYKLAPADEQAVNVTAPNESVTQNDPDNLAAWHYASGGRQFGPLSFTELRQLAARGALQSNAPVWCEGMSDWTEASNIPGLFAKGDFTINCPACHRLLKVTEEAFGKTVPCPLCQHPIAVPAASDGLAMHRQDSAFPLVAAERDSRRGRGAGRRTKIVAGVAGGVFGVFFVVLVLWLFMEPATQRQSIILGTDRTTRLQVSVEGWWQLERLPWVVADVDGVTKAGHHFVNVVLKVANLGPREGHTPFGRGVTRLIALELRTEDGRIYRCSPAGVREDRGVGQPLMTTPDYFFSMEAPNSSLPAARRPVSGFPPSSSHAVDDDRDLRTDVQRRTTRRLAPGTAGWCFLCAEVPLGEKPEALLIDGAELALSKRSHRAPSEFPSSVDDFPGLSRPRGQIPDREPTDAEVAEMGCAACASCGTATMVVVFLVIAILAINIALLVWVARDAKARGMDSAVVWMLLVMFTGLIGLVIYLLSRPQGNVLPCPTCGNKRLQASARCPHCGNP